MHEKLKELFNKESIKLFLDAFDYDFVFGEEIKEHTIKKIDFIKNYVDRWLYVVSNTSDNIFFIDPMCNAGYYKNNILSTSIEVYTLFINHAVEHPNKNYFLLCNDLDSGKVETMEKINNYFETKLKSLNITNVHFAIANNNVNDYIKVIKNHKMFKYNPNCKNIILLFVDPYNLITSELSQSLFDFANNVYSELIINLDTNDFIRNKFNFDAINKRKAIESLCTKFCGLSDFDISTNALTKAFIAKMYLSRYLNKSYTIEVTNSKKAELYRLIFLTPNIHGLRKVKDAAWNTYGFHREYSSSTKDRIDPDIFGFIDEDYAYIDSLEIIENWLKTKKECKLSFEDIEAAVLEETPLKTGHVIKKIIIPLIEKGLLVKNGLVKKTNYKSDFYYVKL